jgi:hypothetical protein
MGPRNSSAIYRLAVAVVALLVLLSLYQQFFQSTQISLCGISNLSSTTATRQRSNFDSEKHDHWEAIDGDVLRNSDCGRQVPNYKPPSSASTLHQSDNSSSKLCNLEGPGPLPVILMTYGRSGSAVTWQAMSALAGGDVINAQEYTGMGPQDRINFFAKHIDETWLKNCSATNVESIPGRASLVPSGSRVLWNYSHNPPVPSGRLFGCESTPILPGLCELYAIPWMYRFRPTSTSWPNKVRHKTDFVHTVTWQTMSAKKPVYEII